MLSAALKEMSGLKEVTGLFDSRAWGTAVLPTLFTTALAATAAVGLVALAGKANDLTTWWSGIGDLGRGLVLTAAGVSVLVAGVVVANVQFALIRFWEGYPAAGVAGVLLLPTRAVTSVGETWAEHDRRRRRAKEARLNAVADEAGEIEQQLDDPTRAPAARQIAAEIGNLFTDVDAESTWPWVRWWNRLLDWYRGVGRTPVRAGNAVKAWTGEKGNANLIRAGTRARELVWAAQPHVADPIVAPQLAGLNAFLADLHTEAQKRALGNAALPLLQPAATPAAADVVEAIGDLFRDVYVGAKRFWSRGWKAQWTHVQTLDVLRARTGKKGDAVLIAAGARGRNLFYVAQSHAADAAVAPRLAELRAFLTALAAEARRRDEENAVELADLAWQTYQYTPGAAPEPLLPTRLGRAVRAAEAYPLARYGADAVFFWPRLAPLLPKEFADRFAAAESALALTCTLATFALAVGLPVAAAATLVAALGFASGAAWWWLVVGPVPAALVLLGFTYRAAADAAEGYADHIRAAFDLYRWKVLEQMGLKLPPTPDDERETWRLLTFWLLYDARKSSPAHLTYAKKDAAFSTPGPETVAVPVPKAAIAAGQPIAAADLEGKEVPVVALDPGSVTVAAQAVGRTTTAPLPAGEVIPIGAVMASPALVALAVPAATLAALRLEPGHRVSVSAARSATGRAGVVTRKGLVVMTVTAPAAGAATGVVVVAAPAGLLDDLARITATDRFVVARAP